MPSLRPVSRRARRRPLATALLPLLLALTLGTACGGGDDPVTPRLAAHDLLGIWDVRDTARLEYDDIASGTRRVAIEVWHGDVRVAPSGRGPNDYFTLRGTVADSLCEGSACVAPASVGLIGGMAYADDERVLGFGLGHLREMPASVISDSGIHWVADEELGPLGACGRIALVFDLPWDAGRCRIATHWRRRPATPAR